MEILRINELTFHFTCADCEHRRDAKIFEDPQQILGLRTVDVMCGSDDTDGSSFTPTMCVDRNAIMGAYDGLPEEFDFDAEALRRRFQALADERGLIHGAGLSVDPDGYHSLMTHFSAPITNFEDLLIIAYLTACEVVTELEHIYESNPEPLSIELLHKYMTGYNCIDIDENYVEFSEYNNLL